MHEEIARAKADGWPPFLAGNADPHTEAARPASRAFLRLGAEGFPEVQLRCSIELTDQP